MPSIKDMMEMISTLVMFALIALLLLSVFGGEGDDIAFANAYPMTQKLVSNINILSASPQNESIIFTIQPSKYKITFDIINNYIECETEFLGKNKYGMFVFRDIQLIASDIECDLDAGCSIKKILVDKKIYSSGQIIIEVSEI
ncbi:MAG: hypothetical protein KAT37_03575 [Candidatus Aenigmarchaeota archaeon]|nr:hypothetical protein [Candidatus Aenigmarchaeota archaeon]